jgi:hypothetical protein
MRLVGLVFCFFSGITSSLFAQTNLVLENNAPLKWYQLNTPNFKVIYPKGFESQANRMANTMEHIRVPESRSIGTQPRKFSLVMQNQSTVSNAFVSITPRRSEFYAMPTQNYNLLGTNDWMNLIASHEFRHMAQFDHSNRGLNKILFYLFGYNTLSAFSYLSVPPWFWEGDAVVTETAFTRSGRGRIPNFDLVFRSNLLEGRTFNYEKQFLRSYKHNIPDHYVFGYHMVSYLRRKTNNAEAWKNITGRTWSMPIMPFTFSRSIKKESGLYVKDLYKEMASNLVSQWKLQLDTLELTKFETINQRYSETYTDYRFPMEIGKDSILVMKSGIGDIEQLVILSSKGEKKFFTPGPTNYSGMLSQAKLKIVWNEFRFDPRFRVHTYSVVMSYDVKNKLPKQITRSTRYASADISPDGAKVAVIETDQEYKTKLVVLDFASGDVLKKFDNPNNDFISMPRWVTNEIFFIVTDKSGKSIQKINYETGKQELLSTFVNENIGHPVPFKNYVLYNSPINGIDNIYALDTNSGKKYQVTESRLGAYNPSISLDGNFIYYNNQQKNGLDVTKISFDPSTWKEIKFVEQPGTLFEPLVEQEGRPHLLDTIPSEQYKPKRYSQLLHMFNIYSWGAYIENDLSKTSVGISSQDVLSTTSLNAGYVFDLNERTGAWNAGVSYQRFLPIIDFKYSIASRNSNQGTIQYKKIVGTDTVLTKDNLTFKWDEKTIESGVRIPLITTTSRYVGNLTFSNYVGYTMIENFANSIDGGGRLLPTDYPQYFFRDFADHGTLLYNNFNLSAYRLLKQSRRDIYSKWGQAIFLNTYSTPYGGDYSGDLFAFQGRMFFPGLFKHHSLWGYWAYQKSSITDVYLNSKQGLDNYIFRNSIPLPRGQSIARFQEFYSMSVNYNLPLCYPDVNVGPLLYVQRIRTNFFYDYGFGKSKNYGEPTSKAYMSVGTEVKFDINLIRFLPQLDVGFRYSYGLTPSVSRFEFLLGTFNF